MKKTITTLFIIAALLMTAPAASAWVIHNNTDYLVGVSGKWSFGFDKFKIRPRKSHKGDSDALLMNVSVSYLSQGQLRQSYSFSIPADGQAKVYPGKVEVYNGAGKVIYTTNMDHFDLR
ncbi:MAG: hypothetical protein KQH53_17740 [Desulfarculaceae bacterium]|nr:hypothetical protein [Desulfarculaceae bacterium]